MVVGVVVAQLLTVYKLALYIYRPECAGSTTEGRQTAAFVNL